MRRKRHDFDLIAIGSGSAGSVGAAYAAGIGKRVAIVEKEAVLGGECPNWACVPTKALLHAADVLATVKSAGQYGVSVKHPDFNWAAAKKWKDLVVSRTGSAQGESIFTEDGITVLRGQAKFITPSQIEVAGQTYSAKRFLLGSGSETAIPPIPGLDPGSYITFMEAIDLPKVPESIFILGGGPIGCEFAQFFMGFGSKVTIADFTDRLMIREDKEAGELIQALFENGGTKVLTSTKVTAVVKKGHNKVVHFETAGKNHSVTVQEVLVATGKKPVTDFGLEKAGVAFDNHAIKVNRYLQTTAPHIFAAGDCIGPFLFTHTSAYQSHLAAQNAFARRKRAVDYTVIPRCTFTVPEVASVGHSEETAKAAGIRFKVGIAPIAMLGRANTENSFDGFAKVLTDSRGVLIGGCIASPRAGELIHEVALAVKLKATASEVADMVHAYPTFSEGVRYACGSVGTSS